jgi:hypothetical protein
VNVESLYDDVVLFDVPLIGDRLFKHLQRDRLVWMPIQDGPELVAVRLRQDPDDLVSLLRTVQAWAGAARLDSIRFELDGRLYELPAPAALARAA